MGIKDLRKEIQIKGEEVLLPEYTCPKCKTVHDAVSCVSSESRPSEGDITVCIACGHLMAFNKDFTLRELSTDEHDEIIQNQHVKSVQDARSRLRRH